MLAGVPSPTDFGMVKQVAEACKKGGWWPSERQRAVRSRSDCEGV